jgi:hypothetical protein
VHCGLGCCHDFDSRRSLYPQEWSILRSLTSECRGFGYVSTRCLKHFKIGAVLSSDSYNDVGQLKRCPRLASTYLVAGINNCTINPRNIGGAWNKYSSGELVAVNSYRGKVDLLRENFTSRCIGRLKFSQRIKQAANLPQQNIVSIFRCIISVKTFCLEFRSIPGKE